MTNKSSIKDYEVGEFYDELFEESGKLRSYARPLESAVASLSTAELRKRQKAAELALFQQGITFAVYGDRRGTEKVMPYDILPRIVPAHEWKVLEKGLKQRITALNLFIDDIYNDQKILKDMIIPREEVFSCSGFLKQCTGIRPPKGIWAHITGTDLVRDHDGTFYVLEDNLRCPSGISYVLENRMIQKRIFPSALRKLRVRPVIEYTDRLYSTLRHIGSEISPDPTVVVLTPGIYNSAYFEHAYLAQQMGVTLAEGRDLTVRDDHVYLMTTKGLQRVDVLYRRIDDTFLDPLEFNPDSLLGVPGIMSCFRKGNIALANAPGTGIADDKAIYSYVPNIIRYYLDEEPIIPNVKTFLCSDPDQCKYVLDNLDTLVVKPVNSSGGYGMLVGTSATKEQRDVFAKKIEDTPHLYIAQPELALSRCPTITEKEIEGRHVDLRPYILYGQSPYVLPGGLTRVALVKDSIVVNSSQGGGSKDTWVLSDEEIKIEEHNHA
ncbi:MAG: hypothetical protein CMO81_01170 [Waddliaceae bacterium]|nr:hypothetical protein [Waddliaceae bacterium]